MNYVTVKERDIPLYSAVLFNVMKDITKYTVMGGMM